MATPATRTEIEPGLWLDCRRVLWLEPAGTLVVADLHWGYAASHQRAGNLLPAWGDDEIARRLNELSADYRPREVVWLGDVVHAAPGCRPAQAFLAQSEVPIVVVRGNHDRAWPADQAVLECERAGFLLHHGDQPRPPVTGRRQLIGHHHPAAWVTHGATRLKLPALVTGPRQWILPAFSPWAAGTPWNHALAADETLWVLAQRRIFPLPRRREA